MKHLSILIPEGDNNISSITGAFEIFTKANGYWKKNYGTDVFQIQLVGLSEEITFNDGLFSVKPHVNISEIGKTDLVLIPSLNHNYDLALTGNDSLVDWVEKQYLQGAEVATICTGVYLLAARGLLDGKSCSTHWSVADNFRSRFPKVDLQTDRLITYENGIYTNGGAYSFLNLMICLIEKYFDRQAAIYCSKVFQIEIDRTSQSEFSIFAGQKHHDDDIIKQAQLFIENNVSERISIEELSSQLAVGRRNFDRRFIKATGNTPIEYTQRVKVESAKKAMESSRKTINEIMYDVGYSDVKAFREVFRKYTGMSPLEYRGRYNKQAVG
jgi:transcriptional regulator GlxA family with amidase domain